MEVVAVRTAVMAVDTSARPDGTCNQKAGTKMRWGEREIEGGEMPKLPPVTAAVGVAAKAKLRTVVKATAVVIAGVEAGAIVGAAAKEIAGVAAGVIADGKTEGTMMTETAKAENTTEEAAAGMKAEIAVMIEITVAKKTTGVASRSVTGVAVRTKMRGAVGVGVGVIARGRAKVAMAIEFAVAENIAGMIANIVAGVAAGAMMQHVQRTRKSCGLHLLSTRQLPSAQERWQ